MSKEARKLYEALREAEHLDPGMSGNWKKDKVKFIRQYNENEELINGSTGIQRDDLFDEWPSSEA